MRLLKRRASTSMLPAMTTRRLLMVGILVVFGLGVVTGYGLHSTSLLAVAGSAAAEGCYTFPETGKTVCEPFLSYWRDHGGLAQQGLPLSDAFMERSDVNGQTYKVQYFERAVFEEHPENAPPYNVLLSLLGREAWARKYPAGPPSGETPLAVGQTFVVRAVSGTGTFRIAVTDIQQRPSLPDPDTQGASLTAKGKYVVVFLRVTNLGSSSGYPGDFRLKDERGRSFDLDFKSSLAAARLYQRKIYGPTSVQPTFSEDMVAVFDVATDGTSFTVVVR